MKNRLLQAKERIVKSMLLKKDLKNTISKLNGVDADVKVSVYDINDGVHAQINGKKKGWAASIIKVPIMVATAQEITKKKLTLDTQLEVNHNLTLEPFDYISTLPEGSAVKVDELLHHMIVDSDNEATNMLVDYLGVEKVNKSMWDLGMKRSMLGHLLCPGAPRYSSGFNRDGSNITCANDMVKVMRHIYDDKYSKLNSDERHISKSVMSYTNPDLLNVGKFKRRNIDAKIGVISDPIDGSDLHEVGIIDQHLIVSIMLNKIGQKEKKEEKEEKVNESIFGYFDVFNLDLIYGDIPYSKPLKPYKEIMKTIGKYFN